MRDMFADHIRVARKAKVFARVLRTKRNCPYLKVSGSGVDVNFVPARKPNGGYVHAYVNAYSMWADLPYGRHYYGLFPLRTARDLIYWHGHTRPRNIKHALEYVGMTHPSRRLLPSGECVFEEV